MLTTTGLLDLQSGGGGGVTAARIVATFSGVLSIAVVSWLRRVRVGRAAVDALEKDRSSMAAA